jgi:glutamyl-tRNA synthetase
MNLFGHKERVVTRYAPSPTGFMHVGGVRTALYAWLFARKHGGTFILRIEDTDKEREVPGSVAHIQETLSWVGLDWDFGPEKPGPFGSCIQSERLDTYLPFAHKLIEKGYAYPDPYSAKELEALRSAAEEAKRPFLFREHRPPTFETWDGTKPLRFKVPTVKRYAWTDEVRGEMEAGEEALDDFILIKSDGYPTYNFAHIIDDHLMGVTHIFRADEFISSTPRFLSLYEALGIDPPKFVTLPPILRADRTKKLGKRDGAKDILSYREEGILPAAMMNFLAFIGWNPGTDQEIFTREELVAAFDIDGVQSGGGALNEEKLAWFNREHLLRADARFIRDYVFAWLLPRVERMPQYSKERALRLVPVIMERIHTGGEIADAAAAGEYDFAFAAPSVLPSMVKWKNDASPKDALSRLRRSAEILSTLAEDSSAEEIKAPLWHFAESEGRGEVLWPLRVALTGRERSPDPFTVIHIIGTAEAYKRVQSACDTIIRTA